MTSVKPCGTIHCGGGRPDNVNDRCRGGLFLEPTVVTGLDACARTNREEVFGPMVAIMPFDDEHQAVEMANQTQYGLSASVWTTNLDRAHRVAGRLQVGTVWVNCWLLRQDGIPFSRCALTTNSVEKIARRSSHRRSLRDYRSTDSHVFFPLKRGLL